MYVSPNISKFERSDLESRSRKRHVIRAECVDRLQLILKKVLRIEGL